MSETVLVNFRLDRDRPMRIKWLATDGSPGDGYKPEISVIVLADGSKLEMDSTAILEQTVVDPDGGVGAYFLTFNGMVGYAADHADRARVEALEDQDIDYELVFLHQDDGRRAVENTDYEVLERPAGYLRKLARKEA
jgi:hypothetical protein